MAIKICLDAGHYGKYNRSPANKNYYESDMAWKLHLLLKKYLEQYGIKVSQTRTNQATDKELTARGKASKGCDLFLSIHSNAVGSGVNESIDYPIVYYPISGKGKAIAQKLTDCIADVMGTKQDGRISTRKGSNGDYYGVIRGATAVGVPGLIIEHSFHTNSKATNWLLNDNNLDKLAQAEAKVIAAYFGLTKNVEPEKPKQPEKIEIKEDEEIVKRFNTINEVPEYAQPTIKKLIDGGMLKGKATGLDLSEDMIRLLVILDRCNKL